MVPPSLMVFLQMAEVQRTYIRLIRVILLHPGSLCAWGGWVLTLQHWDLGQSSQLRHMPWNLTRSWLVRFPPHQVFETSLTTWPDTDESLVRFPKPLARESFLGRRRNWIVLDAIFFFQGKNFMGIFMGSKTSSGWPCRSRSPIQVSFLPGSWNDFFFFWPLNWRSSKKYGLFTVRLTIEGGEEGVSPTRPWPKANVKIGKNSHFYS